MAAITIKEIDFFNSRIQTHGHVSKDPSKRYITIREQGVFGDVLCDAEFDANLVKTAVKQYLLRKANNFLTLSKAV